MKNLYIALSFGLLSCALFAQNKNTKVADKLFNQYEYVAATKEYLKLVENKKADAYVYKQLADTYYNIFNSAEAVKYYAKATESKQDAETYFRYSQMLKANGNYAAANVQMRKFADLAPNDMRAKTFNQNPNYIPKLLSKQAVYSIKTLDINSDKSEFGALLQGNELYFTSARNGARRDYGWTNEPFLDIYKSVKAETGTFALPTLVSSLNSKFHDGPVTFTKDGTTVYFSGDSFREGVFEKDKVNKVRLGRNNLYKATKEGDSFSNIKPLPFNTSAYSISNPSVSKDGKTLYFSSNMPGGIGAVDIWKVTINDDGTYSKPENLGSKVNTEGNESFPFIADDNTTLYFASNGKQGLGGLDIYQVDLSKSTDAVNMGKPLNSEKDDFAFTVNDASKIGYFSSNRVGNDDIFEATGICAFDILTIVSDGKSGKTLPNSKVAIVDDKNNIIATEVTNDQGEVNFRVECEKAYSIQATSDGYEGNVFAVASSSGKQAIVQAVLQPIQEIVKENEVVLKEINFEFNRSNVTQDGAFELDKLVQVLTLNPQMVVMVKAHTDNRGSDVYNLSLSDRRAKSTVQYILSKGISSDRISGKGFGESEPKVTCGDTCTEEQHAQNRRSEFLIVK